MEQEPRLRGKKASQLRTQRRGAWALIPLGVRTFFFFSFSLWNEHKKLVLLSNFLPPEPGLQLHLLYAGLNIGLIYAHCVDDASQLVTHPVVIFFEVLSIPISCIISLKGTSQLFQKYSVCHLMSLGIFYWDILCQSVTMIFSIFIFWIRKISFLSSKVFSILYFLQCVGLEDKKVILLLQRNLSPMLVANVGSSGWFADAKVESKNRCLFELFCITCQRPGDATNVVNVIKKNSKTCPIWAQCLTSLFWKFQHVIP